ncbi:cellulase-like family protein [Actinoplanes sp. NBRC 103695]|uniref:cellulase-like family protein n=1 Tax=Actinoplanes sp. NBRC 103695 TaxID=3032202 RepID=UPI0024A5F6AF|nr:cellulase-like family protein [Actinoplanes sp. NBRC 103695]GLY98867.1 hypothetical protein Acsp02_61210 [Actinoplanes sp. NBRC 103695]
MRAVTLWDFTWYTRTGVGQPFHDLDEAFRQAVERGFDTVRICAMPVLLFRSGLDTTALRFDGLALRDVSRPYPQDRAFDELLRDGAPRLEDWRAPDSWKTAATVVPHREIYTHDWCDPDKWDRWLYDRYGEHRLAMRETLDLWLDVAADFAAGRGIPLVFGEGWVGYTPLHAWFEEGPVGAEICEHAVGRARELGAWGTVVCSNAAPHHPMWNNAAWLRRVNLQENR